jgi:quercetin dioxygenase-like cupin family protein
MSKQRLVGHDVTLKRRRVTIEPGNDTGWHTHPGTLFATVLRGTLTHYDRGSEPTIYRAGDSFIEARGRDAVHLGANHGDEPLVLDVIYVVPLGEPLRLDATS